MTIDMMARRSLNLTPIGERILIQLDEAETQSPGGIVLPDAAQKSANQGTVVAVGSGRVLDNGERLPISVSEGDRVVFQSYAGTTIEVNGETYLALTESEVIAKIH